LTPTKQPKTKNRIGLSKRHILIGIGIVLFCLISFVAVALSLAAVDINYEEPQPTITPTPEPTATPTPTPSPAQFATPEPTATPEPILAPTATPKPTQYIGYCEPVKYVPPAPIYTISADVQGLQKAYAVNDQVVVKAHVTNTGDAFKGLHFIITASEFNRVTQKWVFMGAVNNNMPDIMMNRGGSCDMKDYRWQIPKFYHGFDTRGIWNFGLVIKHDDQELFNQTYQVIIGEMGADGVIGL
jgi:hypothetical protein